MRIGSAYERLVDNKSGGASAREQDYARQRQQEFYRRQQQQYYGHNGRNVSRSCLAFARGGSRSSRVTPHHSCR